MTRSHRIVISIFVVILGLAGFLARRRAIEEKQKEREFIAATFMRGIGQVFSAEIVFAPGPKSEAVRVALQAMIAGNRMPMLPDSIQSVSVEFCPTFAHWVEQVDGVPQADTFVLVATLCGKDGRIETYAMTRDGRTQTVQGNGEQFPWYSQRVSHRISDHPQ